MMGVSQMRKKIICLVFLTLLIIPLMLILARTDEINQYFKRGVEYTNQEKYDKAIKEFTQVITNDKDYANAYLGLGIVYVHKKMNREAIELLKKAIELDPKENMAYFMLARVYEKLEEDKNAIQLWEKFLTLKPEEKYVQMAEKHLKRLRAKK